MQEYCVACGKVYDEANDLHLCPTCLRRMGNDVELFERMSERLDNLAGLMGWSWDGVKWVYTSQPEHVSATNEFKRVCNYADELGFSVRYMSLNRLLGADLFAFVRGEFALFFVDIAPTNERLVQLGRFPGAYEWHMY